jgi:RNA polymerase sigma factor (sigma-70 family)
MERTEDLVAAAMAGDMAAFGRLIDAEAAWAYGTARAIVGFSGDAEDVFQEACLRAWRDLPKLRRPDLWIYWFRRIVTRAAIDGARTGRRVHHGSLDPAGTEPDPAAAAADRNQVLRALLKLPPEERAVLVLRYGHDLATAEVARVLGMAKSRIHRALRKLRDSIGAADEHRG